MRPTGRRTRFAIVAATTASLAALGGFGGWAALSTDASTGHAARESQLSEAYGKARYAVAQFELAVREDQLEPTHANRRRVTAARHRRSERRFRPSTETATPATARSPLSCAADRRDRGRAWAT